MRRCGVGTISVAARRADAAEALLAATGTKKNSSGKSSSMESSSLQIFSLPWEAGALRKALTPAAPTLLVNATPAGLEHLPIDITTLPSTCTILDLRYHYPENDLIPTARTHNLRAADGLEMLLQQGMLSFHLWTNLDPPYDAARAALHAAVTPA
jgi:shikimate dehydrogenase